MHDLPGVFGGETVGKIGVASDDRPDDRVVLVDEPTSALDVHGERRIILGLRELADTGRLVIVVTHRRAVMAAADAVLAVDLVSGRVAAMSEAVRP